MVGEHNREVEGGAGGDGSIECTVLACFLGLLELRLYLPRLSFLSLVWISLVWISGPRDWGSGAWIV